MKNIIIPLFALMCVPAFAQDPAPENMKLFLLIGQSNMAGRGKVEPQDQVVNPRIFMLNKQLHFNATDLRAFGQRYAAEYLKLAKP